MTGSEEEFLIAMQRAESIVRRLGTGDAPLDGELGYCTLCYQNGERGTHDPMCPWQLAREWVGTYP